jgi:hypothetical protein
MQVMTGPSISNTAQHAEQTVTPHLETTLATCVLLVHLPQCSTWHQLGCNHRIAHWVKHCCSCSTHAVLTCQLNPHRWGFRVPSTLNRLPAPTDPPL